MLVCVCAYVRVCVCACTCLCITRMSNDLSGLIFLREKPFSFFEDCKIFRQGSDSPKPAEGGIHQSWICKSWICNFVPPPAVGRLRLGPPAGGGKRRPSFEIRPRSHHVCVLPMYDDLVWCPDSRCQLATTTARFVAPRSQLAFGGLHPPCVRTRPTVQATCTVLTVVHERRESWPSPLGHCTVICRRVHLHTPTHLYPNPP